VLTGPSRMLKQPASGEACEAYLVKRRSFPDSSGRFTFHVSRFTASVHRWVFA
jgi:hypothetical protein